MVEFEKYKFYVSIGGSVYYKFPNGSELSIYDRDDGLYRVWEIINGRVGSGRYEYDNAILIEDFTLEQMIDYFTAFSGHKKRVRRFI